MEEVTEEKKISTAEARSLIEAAQWSGLGEEYVLKDLRPQDYKNLCEALGALGLGFFSEYGKSSGTKTLLVPKKQAQRGRLEMEKA